MSPLKERRISSQNGVLSLDKSAHLRQSFLSFWEVFHVRHYRNDADERRQNEPHGVAAGSEVVLDKVLMLGGDTFKVGAPYVENAAVKGEVIAQGRGPKVMVFKRRRRKDSRKLRGHRQDCTVIRITGISAA